MNKTVTKLVGCFLITTCLFSGCSGAKSTSVKQPKLLEPVNANSKTVTVEYRDIYTLYTYSGRTVPAYKTLCFKDDGVFDRFTVTVGEKVKKGQVLAEQSDEQYEMQLEQEQEAYKKLKSRYQNDRKAASINLKLIAAKIDKQKTILKQAEEAMKEEIQYQIDKLELSRKESIATSNLQDNMYQQQLNAMQKNISYLQERMTNNKIVAPYDGVIYATEELKNGSMVGSDTDIVTIVNPNKQYVLGYNMNRNVGKNLYSTVANIDGVEIELKEASEDEQPADGGTTYDKRFVVKDKNTKIELGKSCLVGQKLNYREHVLSLPREAVYTESATSKYVYKLNGELKEKVYVTVGAETNVYTEIQDGLQEGDVVLVE